MKRIMIILVCLLLVGCAAHRPIVDLKSSAPDKNQYTYEQDLRECQQYAESIDVGGNAVVGAVIGGVLVGTMSAILYAVVGLDPGEGFATGAAIGGIEGGVAGGFGAGQTQIEIINRCMAGRGYMVLH